MADAHQEPDLQHPRHCHDPAGDCREWRRLRGTEGNHSRSGAVRQCQPPCPAGGNGRSDLECEDDEVAARSIPTVDGTYTVVGVLPPDFHPLHMSNPAEFPRVFMPHDTFESGCRAASCRKVRVIARLEPGVTLAQADAELKGQMRALARE